MSIPLSGAPTISPCISQRSGKLPLPQPVQPQGTIGIPTGCCRHEGIARVDCTGRADGTAERTRTGWRLGDAKRSYPCRLLQVPNRRTSRCIRYDQVARFAPKAKAGGGCRDTGSVVCGVGATPTLPTAATSWKEIAQGFQIGPRFGMDQRHVGFIVGRRRRRTRGQYLFVVIPGQTGDDVC